MFSFTPSILINIAVILVVIVACFFVFNELGNLRQKVKVQEAKIRRMKEELMHGVIHQDMTDIGFHQIEAPLFPMNIQFSQSEPDIPAKNDNIFNMSVVSPAKEQTSWIVEDVKAGVAESHKLPDFVDKVESDSGEESHISIEAEIDPVEEDVAVKKPDVVVELVSVEAEVVALKPETETVTVEPETVTVEPEIVAVEEPEVVESVEVVESDVPEPVTPVEFEMPLAFQEEQKDREVDNENNENNVDNEDNEDNEEGSDDIKFGYEDKKVTDLFKDDENDELLVPQIESVKANKVQLNFKKKQKIRLQFNKK